MINFKLEKTMYDLFIDKREVTTQDLYALGFKKHDLQKLVETGKIRRVKRGVYDLDKCIGLLTYSNILFSKKNYERGRKALERCREIEPNNGSVAIRLLYNDLYDKNYEHLFEYFDVLDKNNSLVGYKKDSDMWLYLLSFITEVPERYRERVSSIRLGDILTDKDDKRYDKLTQNRLRMNIMDFKFDDALEISKQISKKNKGFNDSITERLLSMISYKYSNDHRRLFNMIVAGEYDEVKEILENNKAIHGLSSADEQILSIIDALMDVKENGVVPEYSGEEINSLYVALQKKDFRRAYELYLENASKGNKSNRSIGILLERLNLEISTILLGKKEEEKDVSLEEIKSKEEFGLITSNLIRGDVNSALEILDRYLESIGKSEFKSFIINLIMLDVMNEDKTFNQSMEELVCLTKGEELLNVALFFQDYYVALHEKNFRKAAVYFNLISMSSSLGGVEIDTSSMRRSLIDEAFKNGISEKELGLYGNADKEVVPVVEETSLDEVSEEVYTIDSAISELYDGSNVVMLEPMDEDSVNDIVNYVRGFDSIQTLVLEEEDGSKRVVLRYVNKGGEYIDIGQVLREANNMYRNWEYGKVIDTLEGILPKLDTPKSFIYARLGISYYKTTYDGDYSKAIDYLTLASAQSAYEDEYSDYSDLINKLKSKSKYNGKVFEKK